MIETIKLLQGIASEESPQRALDKLDSITRQEVEAIIFYAEKISSDTQTKG